MQQQGDIFSCTVVLKEAYNYIAAYQRICFPSSQPAMVSTRKSRTGLLDDTEVDLDSSPVTANKRAKKLPVRAKEDESSPAAAKNNKVVFGDDDDIPAPTVATKKKPAPKQEESDDESSDDDAAPEAVSTSAAAASVKQNAAAAQKAAQEYG